MRLGAPVYEHGMERKFPEIPPLDEWIATQKRLGYTAAFCPRLPDTSPATVHATAAACAKANILIAEVGAWYNNPISDNEEERRKGIQGSQEKVALAEMIGAKCVVNVSGSRRAYLQPVPDPFDLTPETFDRIVDSCRQIIDGVQPTRTCFTLEVMPYQYPDTADNYLRIIRAVDRKAFGVHYDPCNLVRGVSDFFDNTTLIRDSIEKLGPYIKSVHAKDVALHAGLTVHINEVRPGLGKFDYRALLTGLNRLGPDLPVLLEHLDDTDEYTKGANYIRDVAQQVGATIITH